MWVRLFNWGDPPTASGPAEPEAVLVATSTSSYLNGAGVEQWASGRGEGGQLFHTSSQAQEAQEAHEAQQAQETQAQADKAQQQATTLPSNLTFHQASLPDELWPNFNSDHFLTPIGASPPSSSSNLSTSMVASLINGSISSNGGHLFPLFALLILINLIVILGNILVIVAVYVSVKLRNVTNIFIVSLATADLLLGILVLPYALVYEVSGQTSSDFKPLFLRLFATFSNFFQLFTASSDF